MQDAIRRQITNALTAVFRPIARILLRSGIGVREATEALKVAFVDIGKTDCGRNGKPASISAIAVATGLSRQEVRRLRDAPLAAEYPAISQYGVLPELMHHWHADKEFLNDAGQPKPLPLSGPEGSFASLARRVSAQISVETMKRELLRVDAVEIDRNGALTVKRRSFRPSSNDQTVINSLLHHVRPLISTVVHNTAPMRPATTDGHPQRAAYSRRVMPSEIPKLRRISRERIRDFMFAFDDAFGACEPAEDAQITDDKLSTVVVGAYYFEENNDALGDDW